MTDLSPILRIEKLAAQCDQQVQFASDYYAPLYARLFGLLAAWLRAPNATTDSLVRWFVEAGKGRAVFDVPLLLLAALHREVLSGNGRSGSILSNCWRQCRLQCV